MKNAILTCFVCILLLTPLSPAAAQTSNREILLAELQSLLVQLAKLQKLFAQTEQSEVLGVQQRALTPSKFYEGTYTAIYIVSGTSLKPYKNTVTSTKDIGFWNLFIDVVGEKTVQKYISEFRIYDDSNNKFDAFLEQIDGTNDWILGVNIAYNSLEDTQSTKTVRDLFIHEYAHILHQYEYEAANAFTHSFWQPKSPRSRDYISEYAMQSAEEDFAESFMYFVLYPKPVSSLTRNKKILFFYAYPHFRSIREEIRGRILQ